MADVLPKPLAAPTCKQSHRSGERCHINDSNAPGALQEGDAPGGPTRRAVHPAAARTAERGAGAAAARAGGSARLAPGRAAGVLCGVTISVAGAVIGAGRNAVVVRPKATCRTGPASDNQCMSSSHLRRWLLRLAGFRPVAVATDGRC